MERAIHTVLDLVNGDVAAHRKQFSCSGCNVTDISSNFVQTVITGCAARQSSPSRCLTDENR
jgi:hypothetical protein